MELGYVLVERLKDKQTADALREGMMSNFLMKS